MIGQTLRTVAHLRPEQIVAQAKHRWRGPARRPARLPRGWFELRTLPPDWTGPSPEGAVDEAGRVQLLAAPPFDPIRQGWRPDASPLYRYTLHYHGWLPHLDLASAVALVEDWIDRHPRGVGWEPYPTSMRLLHWLGWLARDGRELPPATSQRVLRSMVQQARHLADHLEHHLDGNHLWTNLCALTAVRLAVEGPELPRLPDLTEALFRATRAQVYPDGTHAERTPSYHCLAAEQLGLVAGLAGGVAPRLAGPLAAVVSRMVEATAAFTHPDGDVALFGDSQRGAPANPRSLAQRMRQGLRSGQATAWHGGFARRCAGPWTLLFNRGDLGMAHQVGHIHADALSLELSLFEERILVDAGVGTYEIGAERTYCRSTQAHNTATVARADQHELWASHRIGRRGRVRPGAWQAHRLGASIRGCRTESWHTRAITLRGDRIEIVDRVTPRAHFEVRYHFPRAIHWTREDAAYRGRTPRGVEFRVEPTGGALSLAAVPGWEAMGRPAPRTALCIASRGEAVRVVFSSLARPG